MERRACEIRAAFLSLPGQLSQAVATSEMILPSDSDLVVKANDVIERAIRSTVVINGRSLSLPELLAVGRPLNTLLVAVLGTLNSTRRSKRRHPRLQNESMKELRADCFAVVQKLSSFQVCVFSSTAIYTYIYKTKPCYM
jgi:hypothetical protein